MSISILNVGHREDETVLLEIATGAAKSGSVHTVSDPVQAHLWASLHQPDLAVVDIRRLNGEGIDFVRRFRTSAACNDIPVLAVLEETDREHRAQALLAGASELITTPLDPYECQVRILNLLTLRAQRRLIDHGGSHRPPEDEAASRYLDLREREVLLRLARAGEFRDEATGAHIVRMGKISRLIAEGLGLPAEQCDLIEVAAPMHDIGKIGIPDAILSKTGPLTRAERKTMETHAQIGYDILRNSRSPYLQCGAEIALAHHEKFDGTGYPYGTGGEDIPLCARIVAVADVYDALSNPRPYKPAWPAARVLEYLSAQSGKHFDPACVAALTARLGFDPSA